MAITIRKSALLYFSAQQMYDLVNDVAAYPQFIDDCVASSVIEQSAGHMVARLSLQKAGVALDFTTRNTLVAPESIVLQLEDGPFSAFAGNWQFIELGESACKVSLYLEFALSGVLRATLAARLLESVGNSLVDAFSQRARLRYGEG